MEKYGHKKVHYFEDQKNTKKFVAKVLRSLQNHFPNVVQASVTGARANQAKLPQCIHGNIVLDGRGQLVTYVS